MDALGWDACDIVLVTGDAYVDHPSFGMTDGAALLSSMAPTAPTARSPAMIAVPVRYFNIRDPPLALAELCQTRRSVFSLLREPLF